KWLASWARRVPQAILFDENVWSRPDNGDFHSITVGVWSAEPERPRTIPKDRLSIINVGRRSRLRLSSVLLPRTLLGIGAGERFSQKVMAEANKSLVQGPSLK
ncbi:hypothetical protein KKD71_04160, partial [Patescibacteria group bacterium]|nr:hypothetical protein [Patescibacteria group bacterium]